MSDDVAALAAAIQADPTTDTPKWESRRLARYLLDSGGRMIVPLPWPKPPLTGNRTRGNPYARAKEVSTALAEAVAAVTAAKLPAIVGAEVTLHYLPPTRQRRDADGMFPTLKVCQDALVACGVLPDDSWVSVPAATCRIHQPRKDLSDDLRCWLQLTNITRKVRTA